jgi:predicted DNA-binding protein with PD1-like motif
MKARVIEDADDVTYVVVCDPGDEAFGVLTQFARAQDLDGPSVHLHVVLGLPDGTTRGGHLLEGRVFPTLEEVIREPDLRAMTRIVLRPIGSPLPRC